MESSDVIRDARANDYLNDIHYYRSQKKRRVNQNLDNDDDDDDEDDNGTHDLIFGSEFPTLRDARTGYHVTPQIRDENKTMLEDINSFLSETRRTRYKSSSRNYHERVTYTDSGMGLNVSFEHADDQYQEIDYKKVEIDHYDDNGEFKKTTYVMETLQHIRTGDLKYYRRGEYLVLCSKAKFECGEVNWQPFYELWGSRAFYSFQFISEVASSGKIKKDTLPLTVKFSSLNDLIAEYRGSMYQVLLWTINSACDSGDVNKEAADHYWKILNEKLHKWSYRKGNKLKDDEIRDLKNRMNDHEITLECDPEVLPLLNRCDRLETPLTVKDRFQDFKIIELTKVTQVSDSHSELSDINYMKFRGPSLHVKGLVTHDDFGFLDSDSKYKCMKNKSKSNLNAWRESYPGFMDFIFVKHGRRMNWNCELFTKKEFFENLFNTLHSERIDATDVVWEDIPLELELDELSEKYKDVKSQQKKEFALYCLSKDIVDKYLQDYVEIKEKANDYNNQCELSDVSSIIPDSRIN